MTLRNAMQVHSSKGLPQSRATWLRALLIFLGMLIVPAGATVKADACIIVTRPADVCVDFDDFCDALELCIEGGVIASSTWVNWDCLGSNAPVEGTIGGGQAIVQCLDPSCPNGSSYAFVITGGVFDLYLTDGGNPVPLQLGAAWTGIEGPCPTLAEDPGVGSPGSLQSMIGGGPDGP